MNLQSNGSTTTQNINFQVLQEPVTIQDTPTQNPPPQSESSTPHFNCGRENNSSIIDVSSTSNPTPQVPAIVDPSITTTNNNNSDIETHGVGASTEETYEVWGGPIVNNDIVYI